MFLFLVVLALECSLLDLCGSGTPWCGSYLFGFGRLFSFKRFLSFLGDHLSAWCDILKYRTPIGNRVVRYYKVSHAFLRNVARHFPVSHASWRNVVRHCLSVARLKEKYRTNSESVALLYSEMSRDTFLCCIKVSHSFARKPARVDSGHF